MMHLINRIFSLHVARRCPKSLTYDPRQWCDVKSLCSVRRHEDDRRRAVVQSASVSRRHRACKLYAHKSI